MKKQGIPYDGFGHTLEMLRRADAAFREKILGNLRRMDPSLAQRLEAGLRGSARRDEDSRVQLERSQHSAATRNYGR